MQKSKRGLQRSLLAAVATGALFAASPGYGQDSARRAYSLEAQTLADALRAVSRASGKEIMFPADAVRGKLAPRLTGSFTIEEAIDRLLDGTGLEAEFRDDAVLIRGRPQPSDEQVYRPAETGDILVTGSRIKGSPPTSPVTILSADAMHTAGHSDLGQAIRSLPQNFAGGQNPGVTFGAGGGSQNVTSASSLNLRGLGPDASLTLLNGHRLAYDSATQGIDISAIPIAAVDRIEIVADGASALYGSDAVAGVANIILKKDFSGIDTAARFGAATDGGFVQQQYSVVTGQRWSSGGVIASAEYQRSTEISARQRSYTAAVPDDTTLYPAQDYVGIVASGHQRIAEGVVFDIDAFYSRRKSDVTAAYVDAGFTHEGSAVADRIESFNVSPRISLDLPGGWRGEVRGTYGKEFVRLRTDYYIGSALYAQYPTRYDNRLAVVEASAEGRIVDLPGGAARLALGGGYRSVGLLGLQQTVMAGSTTTGLAFDDSRNSYFGYGELFVPLVGEGQAIPALHRLSVTAAGRVEKYDRLSSVFTPKLGVIYSPFPGLDLKGSWGKSFKAPTLYQTALPASVTLARASGYASGYPAPAGVLSIDGGRPDLSPERATTWTATIAAHPAAIPGARFELSYFSVNYRDRVLTPISGRAGSLTNPLYSELVVISPSQAQIDAAIALSPLGVTNSTSFPYSSSNVIAIVDARYRNIASFRARGVDFSANVPIDLGPAGRVTAASSVSYIESDQQTNPLGAVVERAGTIFYPPHWRAHLGASWVQGGLTIAPALDYIGDLSDRRTAAVKSVGSMTTVDLTLRYKMKEGGPFGGLDLTLSALNLFNAKPARITVPAFYYPAYDSANYSAIGRTVSFTIEKKW